MANNVHEKHQSTKKSYSHFGKDINRFDNDRRKTQIIIHEIHERHEKRQKEPVIFLG